MKQLGRAIALIGAALAVTAPDANAAETRAEYAAQVNPICQATNAEAERIFDAFLRASKKIQDGAAQASNRLLDRLYASLDANSTAGETSLAAVAPAPGDETLVGNWLTVRQQLLTLNRINLRLIDRLQKLFSSKKFFTPKAEKRERALNRKINRLIAELDRVSKIDLELGTLLGATYCVTGATGVVVTVISPSQGVSKK